ncbi:MAG: acyl-CoA desaturase [Acidobacteria bacterium]|nr:MAG: acyl-CoA desaturase [Acidobacteriota bacterium]REK02809.1 MAG: acyl-CoA desaturase [Acidobacteriota bacterium]REK13387.1 MAG: acyl-CoA desaturase [Acidobacteriota bacterium]REK41381.1 MAG: acyl-CoA desaturase [Acidobacteriota bacterium]
MENVIKIDTKRERGFNWHTIIAVAIFHVIAVAAFFTFSWQNLLAAMILWWISGSLGIGLGYHRLLTHRGYKAPQWFERFLTLCGTLALQAGPLAWVTTHRMHHAYTDTEKDPHSPNNGFIWSHIGWICKGKAQLHEMEEHRRYSPDLLKDPFNEAIEKYYWSTSVVVGLALFAIGGWQMIVWGIFFRTVVGWHATWLVNSATHMWGSRRFETRDTSTNNPLVAAITFGEGWHNNHHAHPRSAKHGLRWFEVDFNWIQIYLLEKAGLLKDVYRFDLDERKNEAVPLKKAA